MRVTTLPRSPRATMPATSCSDPHTFVPVDPPTLRPVRSVTSRIVAIDAASGTRIMRSTTSGRNDGSIRWRPMPSMRDGRPLNADGSPVQAA